MHKIDWKHLATTKGYISLKKAYIYDVQDAAKQRARGQRPMRDKVEFLKKFNWVICHAKHYALQLNKPIHVVLNDWEAKRNYWWLNYYQESRQPKLHKNSLKPYGINGFRKSLKRWHHSKQEIKHQVCHEIQRMCRQTSTKLKPRWTTKQKKNFAKYGR